MRTYRLQRDRFSTRNRTLLALLASSGLLLALASPASAQVRLPPQLDAAQIAGVSALPSVKALHADARGNPTFIEASLGSFGATETARNADTTALMQKLRPLLRGDGTEALNVRRTNADTTRGIRHHRMKQTIAGLEVIGGEAILHVNNSTSQIVSMDMQFLSGAGLPRVPSFAAADAMRNALADAQISNPTYLSQPRLAFRRMPEGAGYLVWVARIQYTDGRGAQHVEDLLANATSGRLLERMPLIQEALNRQIYHYSTGALLISEGGSTGDAAASNVYQFAGNFYSYFSGSYGRDSWNGAGAQMLARVHGTPQGPNNAVFDCSAGTAYFGDGDGATFGTFSASRDVVAHEWTHGVTCSEANLTYSGQSGALNESMSDIFGAAVEASITGVTTNTWLVGEDVYTPGVGGDALRYMRNPTQDGASRDYYPELRSSDDVHYGSGIGNLAFSLLANGGSHPRGKTSTAVAGIGISKASRIFYLALRDYLMSSSGYGAALDTTARVAQEQYGASSAELASTCAAWTAVGVPSSGMYCPVPPDTATLTQGTYSSHIVGITERGFRAGQMGSMSPASTSSGVPYDALADSNISGPIFSVRASDPGAAWLISITVGGVTRTGASATYTYTPASFGLPGTATWRWSTPFGFTGSGTTAVSIAHR